MEKYKKNKYLNFSLSIVLFTTLLSLSGCGFHLIRSSPHEQPINIQIQTNQPYSTFTGILISTLKNNNVTINKTNNKNTDFIVVLGPLENTSQITNISGNSLAGTYTEKYQINVKIIDQKNNKTHFYKFISQGSFSSNSTQKLSQQSQIQSIKEDAYQVLTQKIQKQLNIINQDMVK